MTQRQNQDKKISSRDAGKKVGAGGDAPAGDPQLKNMVEDTISTIGHARSTQQTRLKVEETGTVSFVGNDLVLVQGLPGVLSEELIEFPGDRQGMALNLEPDEVAAVMLDESQSMEAGMEARRTGRVMDVPVGDGLLGRVVDAVGRPLDDLGSTGASERLPVERQAPSIMDRSPVTVPLQTGIRVIDALIPIGRGQRELIIGDRQTGKTAIALDTIINQKNSGVICIYCAMGQRTSAVATLVADLKKYEVMDNCVVVMASGQDPLGMRYVAPYTAMTIGEYFMEQGRDVLVVFDDLTVHAKTYRELSLLMRRPPAREAYPGDIFYVHSRLLERSTHLSDELGGGSLTALPIVETEAQNISAYIPTNLISITDGQIYLSPKLFQGGIFPAVDVGRSVSRVGGKTQLPAYQEISGELRLSYSQFEELEAFARFGTSLEAGTRRTLERGRRVRESLKQGQYSPRSSSQQIAVLLAVTNGLFDNLPTDHVTGAIEKIEGAIAGKASITKKIESGAQLSDDDAGMLLAVSRQALGEPGEE